MIVMKSVPYGSVAIDRNGIRAIQEAGRIVGGVTPYPTWGGGEGPADCCDVFLERHVIRVYGSLQEVMADLGVNCD